MGNVIPDDKFEQLAVVRIRAKFGEEFSAPTEASLRDMMADYAVDVIQLLVQEVTEQYNNNCKCHCNSCCECTFESVLYSLIASKGIKI